MSIPPDQVLSSFGVVLQRKRIARGHTLATLAQSSGIGQPQLQAMEAGRRAPTLSQLLALGQALECEAADLVEKTIIGCNVGGPKR